MRRGLGVSVDYFKLLMAALALSFSNFAFAGFANLAAPATWGGSVGAYTTTAASNASSFFTGGFRAAGGVINVGGRAVVMPAAYRFAANAGQVAAAVVFRTPALAVAAGVVSWVAGECLGVVDGVWSITCGPQTGQVSSGYEYSSSYPGTSGVWYPDVMSAAQEQIRLFNDLETVYWKVVFKDIVYPNGPLSPYVRGDRTHPENLGVTNVGGALVTRSSSCPSGWYVTDAGCVQTPQPVRVSEPDFVQTLGSKPFPANWPAPGQWPADAPLPVYPPILNPDAENNPQPMRVPVGNPVPVPNTNPQQFTQPTVKIVPAPAPDAPWRVDIQPENIPSPDAVGMTDPTPESAPNPDAKPSEKSQFCVENPDVLACAKPVFDTPEDVNVPNVDKNVSISPDSGWGPSSGTCPAPKTITVSGQSYAVPLDQLCQFASGVRPLFISFAWLTAALMLVGVTRKG